MKQPTHAEAPPLLAATLLGASTLTVMSGAALAPAVPALREAFATTPYALDIDFLVRAALTLPGLFIAIGSPATGYLIDRFGRWPFLLVCLLLFGAAGSAGAWLDTLFGILVSRAFLGLAVAGIMTGATTLLGDHYHGEARHRLVGYQGASMAGGGVVFLMASGILAGYHYRLSFLVYLLGLVFVPMAFRCARADHARRLHLLRISPTHASVRPHEGDEDPDAAIGILALIYFLAFSVMMVFYLTPLELPFYIQERFNGGAAEGGFALALPTLIAAVVGVHYRRVRARMTCPAIVGLLLALIGVGFAIVGLAPNRAVLYAGLLPMGLGLGLHGPNINGWLLARAPARYRGRLVGGLTMAIFLGQFASTFFLRGVVERLGTAGAFLALGCAMIAVAPGFAATLWIRRRRRRPRGPLEHRGRSGRPESPRADDQ